MRMRRREFILGLAMLANAGRASAQDHARRVGVLDGAVGGLASGPNNILETTLKEKGWIVGQNLRIEYRVTRGDTDLSRAYARELLALQPDVLFAVTNTSMAHCIPNILTFRLFSRWSAIQSECITLRASQGPAAT